MKTEAKAASAEPVRLLLPQDGLQGPIVAHEGHMHPEVVAADANGGDEPTERHAEASGHAVRQQELIGQRYLSAK